MISSTLRYLRSDVYAAMSTQRYLRSDVYAAISIQRNLRSKTYIVRRSEYEIQISNSVSELVF